MKVSIYDVANATGLSIATVSRALNDTDHVRPKKSGQSSAGHSGTGVCAQYHGPKSGVPAFHIGGSTV